MKLAKFLVVSAGGDARVLNRKPPLGLDEFCYRLNITIPDAWGSIVGEINLRLPDPDPTVEMDELEPTDEVEEP